GRHELDLIHVAADLLARRLPHLRLAVGDRADHADAAVDRRDPFGPPAFVAVAAGLGDVVARDEEPRSRIKAFLDRLAEPIIGAGAVDGQRVGEDRQSHRATTLASYIHTFSSARGDHSTWLATP